MGFKRFMIDVNDTEFMDFDVRKVFTSKKLVNCALRFHCETVGDLINKINRESDLLGVDHCGKLIAHRMMQEIFDLYLEHMESKGKLADYIMRLIELQDMPLDNKNVVLNWKLEVIE